MDFSTRKDTCYISDPADGHYCSECLASIPFELKKGDRCPRCDRLIIGYNNWEGYEEGRSFA